MTTASRVFWIHALTPLHVGAGQGVGFIDLPVMREKATGWPIVPGSTVKGVMRGLFEDSARRGGSGEGAGPRVDNHLIDTAFGRGGQEDRQDQAGSLVYTDARLVLLPVRSVYGTFAWVTCRLALELLRRDLRYAGLEAPAVPSPVDDRTILTPGTVLAKDGEVYLEDLDFRREEGADEWADFLSRQVFPDDPEWVSLFRERMAVVSDDVFGFLAETGTEVAARIRIDPVCRTVEGGALWYEESLPAETLMAGTVWCDRVYGQNGPSAGDLIRAFCARPLRCQLGGKATVGKGLVRLVFSGGEGR